MIYRSGKVPQSVRCELETDEFRANPRYKLIPFGELEREVQAELEGLTADPDFFGILAPEPGSGLRVKSLCRQSAKLFANLSEAGRLPKEFQGVIGSKLYSKIALLVFDEILEVSDNGVLRSGTAAHHLFFESPPTVETQGEINQISIDALRYASTLNIDDINRLSAKIYIYNRLPVTIENKRKWPDRSSMKKFLDIGSSSFISNNYVLSPPHSASAGWLSWTMHGHLLDPQVEAAYKLYVSPRPDYMRMAFLALNTATSAAECFKFKIGEDAHGVLRPDKIVCYFSTFERLTAFANVLRRELRYVPAHGVPFTASLTDCGLLSWGMDPPVDPANPSWLESESWRVWLSKRLAAGIITARQVSGSKIKPWEFALDRLCLEGVDTVNWIPDSKIFAKT